MSIRFDLIRVHQIFVPIAITVKDFIYCQIFFLFFFLLSQGAYKSVIFVMQLEITLSKKKFSKTLLLQNDPLTKYQMFWMKFLIIQFDAPTAYWFTSSPATGRARRSAPHVLVYTNIYDMFRHWPYNYVTLS